MYLALTTIIIFLVLAGFYLTEKIQNKFLIRWIATSFAVLILGMLTFARNSDYQSGIRIWQDVVQKQPDNKRAWNNLGGEFHKVGKLQEAEAVSNVGVVLAQTGNLQEGIDLLEKSATIKPKAIQTQVNLGLFYFEAGKIEKSAESYRRALKLNPHHAQANVNLALIYLKQKKYNEGLKLVNRALEDVPDYPGAAQLKDSLLHEEKNSKSQDPNPKQNLNSKI